MDNQDHIREFKEIRKKFKASRGQFGEVFIGKSCATITNYERGRTEIPEPVMRLARAWEKFLDQIAGEMKCKK
jgi:DNA-binding transcriptional regulator YiaG